MLARDADKAPDWRTSQVVMACQGQTTGGFKHPNRSQTKVDKLSTKKHRRGKWRDQRLLFSSSLVGLPFLVLLVSNCLSCFSAHKACLGSLERRCPVCLACVCVWGATSRSESQTRCDLQKRTPICMLTLWRSSPCYSVSLHS